MSELRADYLEMMRVHTDEGGKLSHQNGMDLLGEVERLREALKGATVISNAAGAEIEALRKQLVCAEAAMRGAIEAIERNSTSAPVLECLKAALPLTSASGIDK